MFSCVQTKVKASEIAVCVSFRIKYGSWNGHSELVGTSMPAGREAEKEKKTFKPIDTSSKPRFRSNRLVAVHSASSYLECISRQRISWGLNKRTLRCTYTHSRIRPICILIFLVYEHPNVSNYLLISSLSIVICKLSLYEHWKVLPKGIRTTKTSVKSNYLYGLGPILGGHLRVPIGTNSISIT